eukprot:1175415-Prorocentrum_minimum.AAC.2
MSSLMLKLNITLVRHRRSSDAYAMHTMCTPIIPTAHTCGATLERRKRRPPPRKCDTKLVGVLAALCYVRTCLPCIPDVLRVIPVPTTARARAAPRGPDA